jgi:hypothetical protein
MLVQAGRISAQVTRLRSTPCSEESRKGMLLECHWMSSRVLKYEGLWMLHTLVVEGLEIWVPHLSPCALLADHADPYLTSKSMRHSLSLCPRSWTDMWHMPGRCSLVDSLSKVKTGQGRDPSIFHQHPAHSSWRRNTQCGVVCRTAI